MNSKSDPILIAIDPEVVQLKKDLRSHLRSLGYTRSERGQLSPPSDTKEVTRLLHGHQRRELLMQQASFVNKTWPALIHHFANGVDVEPGEIDVSVEEVLPKTEAADLFRLASLYWSVPVSQGFGRRVRFLVKDRRVGKLIGIFALGDPVFNLSCRDKLIGWTAEDRRKRLVNVMDAYTLGAIPPYSQLLCGKLVASLATSSEVQNVFCRKYGESRGIISKQYKNAQLTVITTSSSMGRSSLYNRLKLDDRTLFRPIGYTQGYGHFHVPSSIFQQMRELLRRENHQYASGFTFGNCPNWRLRVIRQALKVSGIHGELLRHNIARQVFLCDLASNSFAFLRGEADSPAMLPPQSSEELSILALSRWIVPRAERLPEYITWKREAFLEAITVDETEQPPQRYCCLTSI